MLCLFKSLSSDEGHHRTCLKTSSNPPFFPKVPPPSTINLCSERNRNLGGTYSNHNNALLPGTTLPSQRISMCLEHFPLTVLSVLLRDSLHRSTLSLAVTSEVRHGPATYCPGFSHSCRAPLLPRPTTQCARKSQGRLLGTSDPDMTPRPRPGRHPQKAAR